LNEESHGNLEGQLQARRIDFRQGSDILRWGNQGDGNFKVKHAYALEYKHNCFNKERIWKQIWNHELWTEYLNLSLAPSKEKNHNLGQTPKTWL
jgi:hypothetical protein